MDEVVRVKIEGFFSKYHKQEYKKGEILIRADDIPPGVFYLKEGVVRVYVISKGGEELTLNIFKPVSFFPMSWVVNDSFNRHYYEAMSKLVVYRAPKEAVLAFINKEPEVLYDLIQRIYRGLDGYMLRVEQLLSRNAQGRIITELLIYAKRFGQEHKKKTLRVKMGITQKELAAQTGMARETVNREIQSLKKKGVVDLSKKILTINIEKLEEGLMV